jgi:hypothetical protein
LTFLDPTAAIAHQEAQDRLPQVYPQQFYYKYREKDGKQEQIEWVDVAKRGMITPQVVPMRWKDVQRDQLLLRVLNPFYENWKKGETAPVTGTALESWIADAGLVKVLNQVGIRSVEDFAATEEHLLIKLNIPNIREKVKRAKAFLEAQTSTAKVSAEISKVREENESLRREVAELKSLIEQHAIKKDDDAVKRRPGRPRKVAQEEAIQ